MGKIQDRSKSLKSPRRADKTIGKQQIQYKGKSLLNAKNEAEYKTGTTDAISKIKRGVHFISPMSTY